MRQIVKTCIRLLPVVAVLLLGVELIVANELAGLGKTLGSLDAATAVERSKQEVLATQVASSSSLTTIRQKATTLGFAEPTASQLLTFNPGELPVAIDNSVR